MRHGFTLATAVLTLLCTPASPYDDSLARPILAAHNAVRERVGSPPLVWSYDLENSSREWARQLIAEGGFHPRPRPVHGQNLYEVTGGTVSPERVVADWASEARDYDPASNRCQSRCGHYTQVVWSSTHEVGCAMERTQGREVWVCEYDPPGNIVGERPF